MTAPTGQGGQGALCAHCLAYIPAGETPCDADAFASGCPRRNTPPPRQGRLMPMPPQEVDPLWRLSGLGGGPPPPDYRRRGRGSRGRR